jgi:mannose/fructose/N-acetylgalactosamine-specific phosphotransferase system component IIB
MGVPPDMDVYFHSADDAAAALAGYRADRRRGILLTGDIGTMASLVDRGAVTQVNIGGIHSRPGRVQRMRYVFLSPDEERQLRALEARGVTITAQDVPGAKPVPLDDMLAGVEP